MSDLVGKTSFLMNCFIIDPVGRCLGEVTGEFWYPTEVTPRSMDNGAWQ